MFNESELQSANRVGTYCVKKDSNYFAVLVKFSGCEKTIKGANLSFCTEVSSLIMCPQCFHAFNAQEYKTNFETLFKAQQRGNLVTYYTDPEFPFGGDYLANTDRSRDPASWFYVEGFEKDELVTQEWVHNGQRVIGGDQPNGNLSYHFSGQGKKLICIKDK